MAKSVSAFERALTVHVIVLGKTRRAWDIGYHGICVCVRRVTKEDSVTAGVSFTSNGFDLR